jgi:hypothetical protein
LQSVAAVDPVVIVLLVCCLLVKAKNLPQPVRKRPYQERGRVAHDPAPGVLERSEAPFAALTCGDEGLD